MQRPDVVFSVAAFTFLGIFDYKVTRMRISSQFLRINEKGWRCVMTTRPKWNTSLAVGKVDGLLLATFLIAFSAFGSSAIAHGPEVLAGPPRLESSLKDTGHSGGYTQFKLKWDAMGNGHSLFFESKSTHYQKHSSGTVWVWLEDFDDHYGELTPEILAATHRIRVCVRGAPGCIGGYNRFHFVPAEPCPGGVPN